MNASCIVLYILVGSSLDLETLMLEIFKIINDFGLGIS